MCQAQTASSNSEVEIDAYPYRLTKENAHELISSYDTVVDGMDNFMTRYIVSDECKLQGKPYVYGAIRGLDGQVAVLCRDIPLIDHCFLTKRLH